MATTKARQDLRSKFVRNAIPTEQDFKDLIDAQLNQKDDGIFRNPGEPLSIVAGTDPQKRTVRFYSDETGAAPDWLISLNPGQDPNNEGTNRAGFGIGDGVGVRLFIDTQGNLGVGTNEPKARLHVNGSLRCDVAITGGLADPTGTTRLFMDASGNIGVGTSEPQVPLHVKGGIQCDFLSTDNLNIRSLAFPSSRWQILADDNGFAIVKFISVPPNSVRRMVVALFKPHPDPEQRLSFPLTSI